MDVGYAGCSQCPAGMSGSGVETKEWMVVEGQETNGEIRSSTCSSLTRGWVREGLLCLQLLLLFLVRLLLPKKEILKEKKVMDLMELLVSKLGLAWLVLRGLLVWVLTVPIVVQMVQMAMGLSDNEFPVGPMMVND